VQDRDANSPIPSNGRLFILIVMVCSK